MHRTLLRSGLWQLVARIAVSLVRDEIGVLLNRPFFSFVMIEASCLSRSSRGSFQPVTLPGLAISLQRRAG